MKSRPEGAPDPLRSRVHFDGVRDEVHTNFGGKNQYGISVTVIEAIARSQVSETIDFQEANYHF